MKTPEHVAKVAAALRGKTRSAEQRQRISEARRKRDASGLPTGDVNRTCGACGQPFRTKKPSSKTRFCSRACGYAQRRGENAVNWRHDMPTVECAICATAFRPRASTVQRHTCSYLCKNILQRKRQRNRGTDIERLIASAMDSRGWRYESQYGIPGVGTPDFVLPADRVVIFCDGDYWHSLPGKAERDAQQSVRLTEMGYAVFRFWGREIHASADDCLNRVAEYVSSSCTSGR